MPKQHRTPDPNGRHVRVYVSLLNSPAYRVLSYAAKALFFDLREKLTGTNNGNIEAVMSILKHKGWSSPGTLSKALYELRTMGFLVQTRGGGVEVGSRVCSLYRFTDLPVYEQPKVGVHACNATHDYAKFNSVKEAEAALREGVQQLREVAKGRKQKMAERKKTTLQNSYRTDTGIVAIEGNHRSKNRSSAVPSDTEIVAGNLTSKTPATRMDKGSSAKTKGASL